MLLIHHLITSRCSANLCSSHTTSQPWYLLATGCAICCCLLYQLATFMRIHSKSGHQLCHVRFHS